jgi:hypothetical protein
MRSRWCMNDMELPHSFGRDVMDDVVKVTFGGFEEDGGKIRGDISIPRSWTVAGTCFATEHGQ